MVKKSRKKRKIEVAGRKKRRQKRKMIKKVEGKEDIGG